MATESRTKVICVTATSILFDCGIKMLSQHNQDCCEEHFLFFGDLTLQDFYRLEFDLTGEDFFRRIPGYGIELMPLTGWSVRIPGYGFNNGYYSSAIDLVLERENGEIYAEYDVSECQDYYLE